MTQAATIEALIFDMDGTLVDSEPFAARAWSDWLGQHGHALRDDVLGQMYGLRLLEGAAVIRREYGITLPVEEIATAQDSLRIAALRGNLKPLPGADAILAAGRAGGLRLALATSSLRHHADLTLAETAMSGLFDAEVTGDEVERGKPAPDIFLLAAERLGVSPAACVVFEDSPAGVSAALAAAMRCVWVPGPAHAGVTLDPPPTVRLDDLGEAIAWLASAGVRMPGGMERSV